MAPNDSASSPPQKTGALLRRLDQATVAVLLAVSLAVILSSWSLRGCRQGGVIDIDRSDPLSIDFKVDINTADWPELSLLPNVGEVLANRIVTSRQKDGPFVQHEDLLRVDGIGPKTLEGIRPYLLPLPGTDDVVER